MKYLATLSNANSLLFKLNFTYPDSAVDYVTTFHANDKKLKPLISYSKFKHQVTAINTSLDSFVEEITRKTETKNPAEEH